MAFSAAPMDCGWGAFFTRLYGPPRQGCGRCEAIFRLWRGDGPWPWLPRRATSSPDGDTRGPHQPGNPTWGSRTGLRGGRRECSRG